MLEKHRLPGVFGWWLFPSDPDLCGGGVGGDVSVMLFFVKFRMEVMQGAMRLSWVMSKQW